MPEPSETLSIARDLIAQAKRAGADGADVVVFDGTSLSASWRMGKLEDVERSEAADLGLRAFVGQRQAVVSSTDLSRGALTPLVERVVAMAKAAPEDPYCGLADPGLHATDWPDLDLNDPAEPSAEALGEAAAAAEAAGLGVQGVSNSGGAGAGFSRSRVVLVTSQGFEGAYQGTSHSVSCSMVAGAGTAMERDYDFSSARHLGDLDAPVDIGRQAGEKAVRRLGGVKVASQAVPVVYDPRVAGGLLGHFAGAISGSAIARGTSFLKDQMDQPVFAPGISIIDDPHRRRGLRSKPFDGEGVGNRKMMLIDDGRLTSWLLDTATAKQLGLTSTGHGSRGPSSPPSPSPTNLYMEPGKQTPEELMSGISTGFYITELIGMGVNGVTGDYSRGASGFWIEDGKITYPVSEVTVAGNLKDMFAHMRPADDLQFRYGTNAPTLLVEGMTIAGT